MQNIKSNIQGIEFPSLMIDKAATLSVILKQLEQSQWWDPQTILRKQMQQLSALANHCYLYSPQFKVRMDNANLKPKDLINIDGLRKLPPVTRQGFKFSEHGLFCTKVPESHKPVYEDSTSGSTGESLFVRKTSLNNLLWQAVTMREHLWNNRDFSKRIVVINADIEQFTISPTWGEPVKLLFPSGNLMGINIRTDIKEQIRLIKQFKPSAILTYPNNLNAIIDECERVGETIGGIEYLWCISETVSERLRRRAKKFFGADIQDNYSATELGIAAIQCPVSGLYHIMAENVLIEVLNDQGEECKAGEVGRIVATALHNFAMPVIRYEIGDYAEVGPFCKCGRGLPTLKAIHGRTRNLLTLPDGTRHWPTFLYIKIEDFPKIRQFQFIQHNLHNIETRLFIAAPFSKEEEEKFYDGVRKSFGEHFNITINYFNYRLPVNENGKFEEFISKVL